MRKQFCLSGIAATTIIIISAVMGLARPSTEQLTVASAVAPAYPLMAVASNTSGKVVVEAQVNATGKVTSARAINGHPLLSQAAENAARHWRFTPAASDAGTRTVVLIFVFRIMPKGTAIDELTPVFMPPYQVEVRHRPFEPVVDSDPPSYVRPTRRRRGRTQ